MEQVLVQQQPTAQDLDLLGVTSHKTYTKRLVNDEESFEELLDILKYSKRFAYDTETNGTFDRFSISIVGISFAIIDDTYNEAWYVPFNHFNGDQLSIDHLGDFRGVFEDTSIEKICHNAKFDEMVLSRYGINVAGVGHDTYIMAWLLSEDASRAGRGLKPLVKRHLGVDMSTFEDVISDAPKIRGVDRDYNFGQVELDAALSYACDDSYYTYGLFKYFKPELEEQKILAAYDHIENPFNRVLRNLEARGVNIDLELVNKADKRLPEIAEEVEAEIYKEAGEVFNIGSGKQLGAILFEKLGIGNNVPRTKTGNYSTDKKTLTTYAAKHKIVENVLRRKKIQKTHSTFVEGTKGFIARDGKIHPSFNGCGTVTGRLSGKSPNLQQIEGDEVEEIRVRNFFIPSDGYKFVVADYAQIEYRLMAHFSQDRAMLEAFAAGHDYHEETARKVFKVPVGTDVTHRQRFIAKSINFGIGYGRGPTSLAETLGCSFEEAQEYIKDYYRTFDGLAAFKKHVVKQARRTGFIRTLSGRKRRLLPDIRSDDWMLRSRAERQAFNTKIQGSAADIIKLAMITLEPELTAIGSFMVIQIHDELVIESLEDKTDETVAITKKCMENPFNGKNPLRLPIITEPVVVDHWGDAK